LEHDGWELRTETVAGQDEYADVSAVDLDCYNVINSDEVFDV
jgi:hypothetical protein